MINRIFLSNFRLFERLDLQLRPGINAFIGRNAQGKTSILEAVYFAAVGIARAPHDADLIRWGADNSLIRIDFTSNAVPHTLTVSLSRTARRTLALDSNPISRRDLMGRLPAVMFSPDDLFLFKAPPAARRRFIDALISQLYPSYFADLSAYNRLISQRNALLKSIREFRANPSSLALFNDALAPLASNITSRRLHLISRLNDAAQPLHLELSDSSERLSISPDIHAAHLPDTAFTTDWYARAFASHTSIDLRRGSTGIGPHLDDLTFSLNSRPIRHFASQGQARTAALSLILSACILSAPALLLLDDLFSELDTARRARLLAFLHASHIQSLATSTDRSTFDAATVFTVDGGTVYG